MGFLNWGTEEDLSSVLKKSAASTPEPAEQEGRSSRRITTNPVKQRTLIG